MPDRPRKIARLTVSLDERDYDALNTIAFAKDASLSWVIRQAVRQFIGREREPKARAERKNAVPTLRKR